MRTFLIIVAVAIILLLGAFAWRGANRSQLPAASSTPNAGSSEQSNLKTYTDPNGEFSFQYPSQFSVLGRQEASTSIPTGWSNFSQRPGAILAAVKIQSSYMPQTNFAEAWFVIGRSSDAQAIRDCTKDISHVSTSTAEIDGQTYKKLNATDAGAGNYYDTTDYRAILDGDCISVEYTIHYGNYLNYDPSLGIKEFDIDKVKSLLDGMAKSFKYRVNSN